MVGTRKRNWRDVIYEGSGKLLPYVAKEAARYARKRLQDSLKNRRRNSGRTNNNGNGMRKIYTQRGSGTKYIKSSRAKRRRGPKTLKKRIKALEKGKLPNSTYTETFKHDIKMIVADNNKTVFWVSAMNHLEVEQTIDAVAYPTGTANLTTATHNNSTKIDVFSTLELTCSALHAAKVRVCRLKAKDNSSVTPTGQLNRHLVDRAYGTYFNLNTPTAPTANTSLIPERVVQNEPVVNHKVLSECWTAPAGTWEQIGKVESFNLNPGDKTVLKFARNFIYKPEVHDQKPSDLYLKNYDAGFVVEVQGELGHGTVDINKVGYCATSIDAMLNTKYKATVQNGGGIHFREAQGGTYVANPAPIFVQAGADNVFE